jgi:hypothetical protein
MSVERKTDAAGGRPTEAGLPAVIDEFGRLLQVFGGQLAESLQEADREYAHVGQAFHELAAAKVRIGAVECPQPQKAVLARQCSRIDESLQGAVVALQCHDRLAQRLGHIRAGLDHLQALLRDGVDRSGIEWLALLQNVERAHHGEQQRLAGAAAQDAAQSTVELF